MADGTSVIRGLLFVIASPSVHFAFPFCFKRCYVVDLGAGWVGSELRRGRHHYLVYGMN